MRKEVKQIYASYGVDVNKVLKQLAKTKISLHCWQLDDVVGFESSGSLTGGIQTTGNYPGRARNFEELKRDLDVALKHIPGSKKINLHAIYQTGKIVERCDVGASKDAFLAIISTGSSLINQERKDDSCFMIGELPIFISVEILDNNGLHKRVLECDSIIRNGLAHPFIDVSQNAIDASFYGDRFGIYAG